MNVGLDAEHVRADAPRLRVAIDVTPLIGNRTGIGSFVDALFHGLQPVDDIRAVPYALTWRGRGQLVNHGPIPARLMRAVWARASSPRLQRWIGPVDVVHATNYVLPPTGRTPSLVSVHDLAMVHHPAWGDRANADMPALVKRAVARGAHIHVDSATVGLQVVEWLGIDSSRVHHVPLSVRPITDPVIPADSANSSDGASNRHSADNPHSADTGGGGAEGQRHGLSIMEPLAGRPFLLAIGTIEPRKDYPTLLRAFASLHRSAPEVLLVIVGSDGWGTEDFDAALARLDASARRSIVRLGYVDQHTKETLLRAASCFVYPSLDEGFGLPPLEAMSANTVVVASNAGSLPEVLGDAALLVPPGDDSALATAILRVLTDDALAESLRAAGRACSRKYPQSRMVDELRAVYRKLNDTGVRVGSIPTRVAS